MRGKECFVVIKIEQYLYLREIKLEAALYEAQRELAAGGFSENIVSVCRLTVFVMSYTRFFF